MIFHDLHKIACNKFSGKICNLVIIVSKGSCVNSINMTPCTLEPSQRQIFTYFRSSGDEVSVYER